MSGPRPDVAALSRRLDRVCFTGAVSAADLDAVDRAMSAALDAIEDQLDTGSAPRDAVAVLGAAFELVAGLRRARWSRAEARVIGGTVLAHLLTFLDGQGPLERFAAAVASLTADDTASRFDPTPDPDCPLETAIVHALADPAHRPALLRVLGGATVCVPVLSVGGGAPPDRADVQLAALEVGGRPAVVAYTSEARLQAHGAAAGVRVEALRVRGAELRHVVPPGHGVVLNPGSVVGAGVSDVELRGPWVSRAGGRGSPPSAA